MANWTWSLRSRDGAMNGLEFARATTASGFTRALIHAAPTQLSVEVIDHQGIMVARADTLDRTSDYLPMTLLTMDGDTISRSEVWPSDDLYGLPVLLAGGEVGLLREWHNSEDHSLLTIRDDPLIGPRRIRKSESDPSPLLRAKTFPAQGSSGPPVANVRHQSGLFESPPPNHFKPAISSNW